MSWISWEAAMTTTASASTVKKRRIQNVALTTFSLFLTTSQLSEGRSALSRITYRPHPTSRIRQYPTCTLDSLLQVALSSCRFPSMNFKLNCSLEMRQPLAVAFRSIS